MNHNKKYFIFVMFIDGLFCTRIFGLVPHIASTVKDDPSESNYSTKQISDDYGNSLSLFLQPLLLRSMIARGSNIDAITRISLEIEDEKTNDYVKVIAHGITSNVVLPKAGNDDPVITQTNDETIRVVYDNKNDFLSVTAYAQRWGVEKKEQEKQRVQTLYHRGSQEKTICQQLKSGIQQHKRVTKYDPKNQTLTITIPRVKKDKQGK